MIGNIVESSLNTQFFTVQQATADDSRVECFMSFLPSPSILSKILTLLRINPVDYYSSSVRLRKFLLLKLGVQKVFFINLGTLCIFSVTGNTEITRKVKSCACFLTEL